MKNQTLPCATCMPDARVELVTTQEAALARYWELFKKGLFPSMCKHDDGAFRICHGDGQEKLAGRRRAGQAVF